MKKILIRWFTYTCITFLCYIVLYYFKHGKFDLDFNIITLIISSFIFFGVSIFDHIKKK